MMSPPLSERQQREREFHEELARRRAVREICFDPVLGSETRPWNEYWAVCRIVRHHFNSPDQTLLDFGCGYGSFSIPFARLGYEVYGFDISPSNISLAQSLAHQYGLADRLHFSVQCAEHLDYPSGYFDAIVGVDILHHVEIRPAVIECLRMLKPGGIAVFREPFKAPLFDSLRNSPLGRWIVPNTASFDRYVTEDERKLTAVDLQAIREMACDVSVQRFRVISRLDKLIGDDPTVRKLDMHLLRALPFLQRLAGTVVLTIKKRG
jgi:2-polyprenyl-3-methyl-5-hydroxy-6-metoxy-1,4-benzoquinol methylase